jgi:hypothetical protein
MMIAVNHGQAGERGRVDVDLAEALVASVSVTVHSSELSDAPARA